MSDVIWAALISALGAIIVTLITQYFQGGKANSQAGTERKTKSARWIILLSAILIVGILIFWLIKVGNREGSTPIGETPSPSTALSESKVEFKIIANNNQIIIPAGGTINTLHQGDSITIESTVANQRGDPYPGELTFLYYFASGGSFSGKIAPYFVRQSDTITVKIEDQLTHEVITRTVLVSIK